MSDRDRPQRRRSRDRDDRAELVPNRLSVELRPNRLSILERADRPAVVPVSDQAPPRTSPGPSTRRPRLGLSTILFVAFVALSLLARISDRPSGQDGPDPTSGSGGLVATAAASAPSDAGAVVFGTGRSEGCVVTGQADVFPSKTEVWWAARFLAPLQPAERIRWLVTFEGGVEREAVGPTQQPVGPWNGVCGDEPLVFTDPGEYTFRVEHSSTHEVLATGSFVVD